MSNAVENASISGAVHLARKMATVAPAGVRLGGPGTRSKNPKRYDAHPKAKKDG